MGVSIFARAAALLAASAVLAGCTGGSGSDDRAGGEPGTPTPTASASPAPDAPGAYYVALGDSFTAGPGLPQPQPDAGYCQRSGLNWPSLLAAHLKAETFADLSCSGATTADQATTAATNPRLGTGTQLVTISVGGNDGALFTSLISACSNATGSCDRYVRNEAPAILERTAASVSGLVEDVRKKAPTSRILMVGYLPIMPTSATDTCSGAGIPASEVESVVMAEGLLETTLEKAAGEAGVEFVSLRAMAEGHDACSGDRAWVNGSVPASNDGIFFHPRRAGMKAVAGELADALENSQS